nr:hypothetical protein [Tanacetum cinerariifolium]
GLRSWEWCGGDGVECRVRKGGGLYMEVLVLSNEVMVLVKWLMVVICLWIWALIGPVKDLLVNPISIDDYEFVDADDQVVAGGDDASFPSVDDAELHIPQ